MNEVQIEILCMLALLGPIRASHLNVTGRTSEEVQEAMQWLLSRYLVLWDRGAGNFYITRKGVEVFKQIRSGVTPADPAAGHPKLTTK